MSQPAQNNSQHVNNSPAVIYCRVSSKKQVKEGDGLQSQEQRCKNYAQMHGYNVIDDFSDDGVTGAIYERPGIKKMLDFLKAQIEETVVIVDDISRVARDVTAHFQIRAAIKIAGGRLESPSFTFGETATDQLLETIMAATAQYGRRGNKEQVMNRMRARLERGYWTFHPPVGYMFEKHPVHKQLLVPSDLAPIVQEALEGFARGRFARIVDVVQFLSVHPHWGTMSRVPLQNRTKEMLTQPLYAGLVGFAPWEMPLLKGIHEPLIREETYHAILKRLMQSEQAVTAPTTARGYPLRGLVRCAVCQYPLTTSRCRGRDAYYSYYHCFNERCDRKGKGVRVENLESDFLTRLEEFKPSPRSFLLLGNWVEKMCGNVIEQKTEVRKAAKVTLRDVERQQSSLAMRLAETQSTVVIRTLEEKIEALEAERIALQVSLNGEDSEVVPKTLRTTLEKVQSYLEMPSDKWKTGDVKVQETVARMVFPKSVFYDRNEGLRTAEYSLLYRILGVLEEGENGVVDIADTFSNHLEQSSYVGCFHLFHLACAEIERCGFLVQNAEARLPQPTHRTISKRSSATRRASRIISTLSSTGSDICITAKTTHFVGTSSYRSV
jgi:site-specific DNA recombinase